MNIIINEITNFNEAYPKVPRPFINWIPNYGGLLVLPNRFPDEKEINYMKQAEIAFVHQCSQEEPKLVEDDFIYPEDIADE
jgi:hypothetical protein